MRSAYIWLGPFGSALLTDIMSQMAVEVERIAILVSAVCTSTHINNLMALCIRLLLIQREIIDAKKNNLARKACTKLCNGWIICIKNQCCRRRKLLNGMLPALDNRV